ncbi:hypothetical protein M8C14_12255 [Bacillus subtilis subsp. subtilis]
MSELSEVPDMNLLEKEITEIKTEQKTLEQRVSVLERSSDSASLTFYQKSVPAPHAPTPKKHPENTQDAGHYFNSSFTSTFPLVAFE